MTNWIGLKLYSLFKYSEIISCNMNFLINYLLIKQVWGLWSYKSHLLSILKYISNQKRCEHAQLQQWRRKHLLFLTSVWLFTVRVSRDLACGGKISAFHVQLENLFFPSCVWHTCIYVLWKYVDMHMGAGVCSYLWMWRLMPGVFLHHPLSLHWGRISPLPPVERRAV